MTLRTFNDLLAIFPDLGENGARPEGEATTISASTATQLTSAHCTYSADLQAAIQFWTANNDKLLPFMDEEDRLGDVSAFANMVSARTQVLTNQGFSQTPGVDAQNWCRKVKQHADQLRAASHPLTFGSSSIFRGEAIDASQVAIEYAVGRTICWSLPRSFTIDDEFIPLHFAWKQWNLLAGKGVSPSGIIFELELHAERNTPLLWASEAPPPQRRTDMRWQKEVITAAGLKAEITSCNQITNAPFYHVKAVEIRS